jgi:hypothetical protein
MAVTCSPFGSVVVSMAGGLDSNQNIYSTLSRATSLRADVVQIPYAEMSPALPALISFLTCRAADFDRPENRLDEERGR